MMKAAMPENESLRLKALRDLAILDTSNEQNFDDLANIAAHVCQVPIALVSLVDENRQWFKSCIGLDVRETSRDLAFCAHAILAPDDVLVIEDATLDARFADNALVNGPPHIRFYAGAPLVTPEGYALGTLCVIDSQPRQLTPAQREVLKALARQVVQLLILKSTRDDMQHTAEHLQSIIRGTNAGTWEWDVPSGRVTINERWASMLGYTLKELQPVIIDTWKRLLHADDFSQTVYALEQHLEGKTAFYDQQFRMRSKAGDWLWIHSHGRVVSRAADGSPLLISGMHTDVTDVKNTYERLREREDLLRSMLSNFPGAAYRRSVQHEQTIHYLSAAVEQLTGYSAAHFSAGYIQFTALTHPDDLTRVNALVVQALRTGMVFDVEYRIKRADGVWRHVQEIGRGVYSDAGNLEFIDGFIWDVQARYDSEYEKHAINNRITQLYKMAPLGIILVNGDGYLQEANPEFIKMLGYSEAELFHKNFMELTPPEEWDLSLREINVLKGTGRFGPIEKHYVAKSGEKIPVEVSGALIQTKDSKEVSWWTLVKDIREQKRIERMKNEFISTVSHELRTPLTSISGALGLLISGHMGDMSDRAKHMLEISHKNSQRLNLLINDLLDMEKLLAGKMYIECKPHRVGAMVKQSVVENKAYADKYGISYRIFDMAPGAVIAVDSFRFQQVLSNLLSNAAKYSPPGMTVEISIEAKEQRIRISVRDYGVGLSEDFKPRIFQKFSQADASDSRQKGGTGLGLAISKELVEHMGGVIGFDRELQQGSCFYIEFEKHSVPTAKKEDGHE